MSERDVLLTRSGARLDVVIDRPRRLNALRTRTLAELCEAFALAADDPSIGVVGLSGAGERAFCVGGDVREPTRTERAKREQLRLYLQLGELMRTCGVPVIVRVRGYCIGAGNEMNVIADLTISGESGVFGQAGTRLGWAPTCGPRRRSPGRSATSGPARSSTCRRDPAEEAARMGLVNVVVPDDELDAEVDRWCETILRRSPEGLRLAKTGLNAASDHARQSILPQVEAHALSYLHGPDAAEGMAAFREGRAAD